MTSAPSTSPDVSPWVKILDQVEEYSFGSLFRVVRARLRHRRFDGQMSDPITRINFERGDSVGVLLYDTEDEAVVLVRQFRYPAYAGLAPTEQAGEGARKAWLLEIVAGIKDKGQTATEVAHRELLEEAGYEVLGDLQPIASIYPSPGGTSERIHLFIGEVNDRQRSGHGGGVGAEGEDIQIVVLPFRVAMSMIDRGEISDAKTIIALQHLALQKAGQQAATVG